MCGHMGCSAGRSSHAGRCPMAGWILGQFSTGEDWTSLSLLYNRAKNPEVVERVQRGQILSQPGNCPIKVYEVCTTNQHPPTLLPLITLFCEGYAAVLGNSSWGPTRLPADQGAIVKHCSDSWTSNSVTREDQAACKEAFVHLGDGALCQSWSKILSEAELCCW